MYKLLVFLALFLPSISGFASSSEPAAPCSCPNVTDVQETGQTSSSISYSWNNGYSGAQFKLWYTRQEDSYTSGFFYTNNLSYNFTGLSAGHYTFFFQALCEEETSGIIGIEDTIIL
ncbi:MAG: hypothetical protein Q7T20_01800 [Saprospiraceae bacterium]|nr:hypothetical protein [Saprospiraceae bacterium]